MNIDALDPGLVLFICIAPLVFALIIGTLLINKITKKKIRPIKLSPGAMRYFQAVSNMAMQDMQEYINQRLNLESEEDREILAILGGRRMFQEMAAHIFERNLRKMREEREKEHVGN